MDRLVFVVRHSRKDLYEGLRALLGGEAGVEVILDRRCEQRRRRDQPHAEERRRWDRRLRPLVDADLAARGWAVVRVAE